MCDDSVVESMFAKNGVAFHCGVVHERLPCTQIPQGGSYSMFSRVSADNCLPSVLG